MKSVVDFDTSENGKTEVWRDRRSCKTMGIKALAMQQLLSTNVPYIFQIGNSGEYLLDVLVQVCHSSV